jgi:hypothetical protein
MLGHLRGKRFEVAIELAPGTAGAPAAPSRCLRARAL